jgi:hypothetical protein
VVSPCLICGRGGQREVDAKGDVFEKRVRCDRLRTNFFCCMSMSLGQSYTTPFPNTGVVKC